MKIKSSSYAVQSMILLESDKIYLPNDLENRLSLLNEIH